MDVDAVAAAVDEVGRTLRADGADLRLVEADPKTLRIRLALDVADAECAECVLPPDQLRLVLEDALARRLLGEFELLVDDPRPGGAR